MNPDPNCPFCQIAAGKLGEIIWQNDLFCAFEDFKPKADNHILIIPKEHISNLDDFSEKDLASGLISAVKTVASEQKLDSGYRLIINNKQGGGQVVPHLHVHLLAGDNLFSF